MKKIYLFFCIGALLLTACEDLIDVGYPSNQLGTPQVFEDVQTADAALANVYALVRDRSVLTGGSGIGSCGGSYADELDCYYNDQNGHMDIYQNQLQETNTYISTIWRDSYQQIYYANAVIYGVEQSATLSGDDRNRIKGEALLLRSLLYFYLQQLFGDIPYTASLDYEYNRTIGKTKAAILLEQLETDVTEATVLLEDDYRDAERIYPNRKAAQLLLARIYLTREEWLLAEQTAKKIIQSPLYHYEADIHEVFHKSGKHILWQLKPQNSGDATSEVTLYYFDNSAPHNYALTQHLVDAFPDDDLRKQAWIAEITVNGQSWYRPDKYKNRSNNTNEYSIMFRLEEVYFIMAEALARQNKVDEALPYLNASRERAGLVPFTSLPAEEFHKELRVEKRREFFAEFAHRFLDLKRWGELDELSALKPNWEEYKHVWPLPQSELLMNPNLYPQNTGY
ncbi:MAG: RagB/SusD family nutrient uptake outer membrane protein [Petrimonas sp.]|uniref:RagB/SusD family nutrient uptake outer membrane protein n=1 Tax=Petrimonas sp. TaxID=2023866 RepID=UPI002B3A61F9|nr:RagB/SusD family nutrient uptake outer membrane protein [Petrimonas sp.]